MKNNSVNIKMIVSILLGIFTIASCSDNSNIADAYGNFEADEVIVSAQSQGILLRMDAFEGEMLDENQPVGIIDTTDSVIKRNQLSAQLNVNMARMQNLAAQLIVQEKQRMNLEREEERMRKLLAEQAATQQQYDDIEGRLNVHILQIEALESQQRIITAERNVLFQQLAEVDRLLDKCRIINPVSGTVLEQYAEQGELVTPGRAIYKIANLTNMQLKFYISGDQLATIAIGDSIMVAIDREDNQMERLTGVITWISSEVEFTPKIIQTRDERVNMVYAVKLLVHNDGRLKIGMPGEVIFMNSNE